jgi:hypothetical protein
LNTAVTINASGWLWVVPRVSLVGAAALASMEVAEWLKDTPLGCYRQTPRVMNAAPNQVREMTVVARQVNKPGRVTGFSWVVESLDEGTRWTRPSCRSGGRKNFLRRRVIGMDIDREAIVVASLRAGRPRATIGDCPETMGRRDATVSAATTVEPSVGTALGVPMLALSLVDVMRDKRQCHEECLCHDSWRFERPSRG